MSSGKRRPPATIAGLLRELENPSAKNADWRAADELARRGRPPLAKLIDRLTEVLESDEPWTDLRPEGESRVKTKRLWSRHWRLGQYIGHLVWLIVQRGEPEGDRALASVFTDPRTTPSTALTVAVLALGDRETELETRMASPVLLRPITRWIDEIEHRRVLIGIRALLVLEPEAALESVERRVADHDLADDTGARLLADLIAAVWSVPSLRDRAFPLLRQVFVSNRITSVWHLAHGLAGMLADTVPERLATVAGDPVSDDTFTDIVTALQSAADPSVIETLRALTLPADRRERIDTLIAKLEGTHVEPEVAVRYEFTESASSDGGPVMVMPAEVAPLWRATDTDHYDDACEVCETGLLPLGELAVLVMPEMYCQWMPIDANTALVSLAGDIAETHRFLLAGDPWTREVGELRLPSGMAVLGAALDPGDADYNARVELAPGTYEVREAKIFDERGEIWAVRLRRSTG